MIRTRHFPLWRGRRSLFLAPLMLAAIVLGAGRLSVAFAHAEPATVSPGDGAILLYPPKSYVITMSQEMFKDNLGSNDIDIFNAAGEEVTPVAAVIDNNDRRKLSVILPSSLPAGAYRVEWKTLSADDGDAANGTLGFTYDPKAIPIPGTEVLKESSAPNAGNTPSGVSAPVATSGDSGGLSARGSSATWVTTIAVGFMTFVLGAGTTYVVLDRKR